MLLENYILAQRRLLAIGAPLLLRNADLCPRRAWTPGFTVISDFDVPDPLQDVAYERMLLGRTATVLSAMPGTKAWLNGLRPGDQLLTINGRTVRNAADARAKLRKADPAREWTYGFVRDGQVFSLTLPFVPICNYRLIYADAWRRPEKFRDVNASATGKEIVVYQGMMENTSDDELAVVLGHELAHNIMHHAPKKMQNAIVVTAVGGVIDTVAGLGGIDAGMREKLQAAYTHVWSQKFEIEADYVGLYLMARAGNADIDAAAPFWRKMAALHGMSSVKLPGGSVRTHPDSPVRFKVLEKTALEIKDKSKRNEPLTPNLQRAWNFGERYAWWNDSDEDDDEPDDEDLNH